MFYENYCFGSNILELIFINKYFKFRIFQSNSWNYLTKIMLQFYK